MKSWNGKKIKMTIPLKSPLPKLTSSYKLSDNEERSLNDILDYLIHYHLAENVNDANQQQGSPVFLVSRPDSQRGPGVVVDTRICTVFFYNFLETGSSDRTLIGLDQLL